MTNTVLLFWCEAGLRDVSDMSPRFQNIVEKPVTIVRTGNSDLSPELGFNAFGRNNRKPFSIRETITGGSLVEYVIVSRYLASVQHLANNLIW